MKKYILIILLLTITSCQFQEKEAETEVAEYQFKDLKIRSIKSGNQEINSKKNETQFDEIADYLKNLTDQDLITGKRLHGAEEICSVTIKSENDEISIIFKSDQKKKITASFLKQNVNQSFINSLGRLEDGKELLQLLKKNGINCKQKIGHKV
jgi:hypothetical protein